MSYLERSGRDFGKMDIAGRAVLFRQPIVLMNNFLLVKIGGNVSVEKDLKRERKEQRRM